MSTANCTPHNAQDLTNRRFGRLIALYPTGKTKNRSRIWYCKCDCGNFKEATARNLNRGAVKSCGCIRSQAPRAVYAIQNNLHFVNGTCIEHLISARTRPVKSASGVRGVYYQKKRHCYAAYIGFQGKMHYLGSFTCLKDAAAARHAAEHQLHDTFLQEYYCKCSLSTKKYTTNST